WAAGSIASALTSLGLAGATGAKGVGVLTTSLGLLGKAVAVAGAAMAGWQLGKWIGEVSGATDWIGQKLAKALYGVAEASYQASRAAATHAAATRDQGGAAAATTGDLGREIDALMANAKAQADAAAKALGAAGAQQTQARATRETTRAVHEQRDAIGELAE